MTTDGGGWTLGVNSVYGDGSETNDMVNNTGTVGISNGHTRDLENLAITREAEIRHVITNLSGTVLLDAYYEGKYHDPMASSGWTILDGSLDLLSYHMGIAWSDIGNDNDLWTGD